MKKLILSILLVLTFSPQTFAFDTESLTEEQVIEIAKRYVICEGYYSPSKIEGKPMVYFSEKSKRWLVSFPSSETPDGAYIVDTGMTIFISEEGEVVYVL